MRLATSRRVRTDHHAVLRPALLALALALALGSGCGGSKAAGPGTPGGPSDPGTPPDQLDATPVADAADVVVYAGTGEDEFTLMSIVTRAGFDLMSPDGSQFRPAEAPRQGVAFEMGDLRLLSRAMAQGPRIALDDLLASWSTVVPAPTPDVLAALQAQLRSRLVADLAAAAASANPVRRYWSHVIVALGRQAEAPHDLLDPAVPGASLLDPVQVALLTYAFQAELWAAVQPGGRFAAAALPRALAAAAGPRPCTMTDTEQTVMDVAALGVSTFMGGVIGAVAEHVPAAQRFSSFSAGANAALTVVKLLWTFLVFDGKLELDAPLLVRTRDATAGEPRTFTGTFRYDTGDGQVLNCVRPALNAAGIDFSLPQDGPIADAKVDWELFGTKARVAGKLPIVRFQEGQVPLGGRTGPDGTRQVIVEGAPQSPPVGASAIPDYRASKMFAKVALKDSKLWTDLQDAVGAALAGNPASIFLSAISETLLRMNGPLFSAGLGFTVKDWTDAGNAVIHVTISEHRTGTVDAAGRGTEAVDLDVDIWRKLKGTLRPLAVVFVDSTGGFGSAELTENSRLALTYSGNYDRTDPCACVVGDSTTFEQSAEHLGGAVEDANFLLLEVQPDGTFTMQVPLGSMAGTSSGQFSTSGCGLAGASRTWSDYLRAALPGVVVTGQLDLSKASGDISGTATLATSLAVPGMLGGLYAAGVSQLPLSPVVTVQYAFSYTLTRIPTAASLSAPPAPSPSPSSSPAAARVVVPAFTSAQAAPRITAAALMCGGGGGP